MILIFDSIINKLNKLLDTKNKIKQSIQKLNSKLTDDVPFNKYHEYLQETRMNEEDRKAIEYYELHTNNSTNFSGFYPYYESGYTSLFIDKLIDEGLLKVHTFDEKGNEELIKFYLQYLLRVHNDRNNSLRNHKSL